jgi:hypothetical protein
LKPFPISRKALVGVQLIRNYSIVQIYRKLETGGKSSSVAALDAVFRPLYNFIWYRKERIRLSVSLVQIAIMGCIVNGPGEMADADFGYVGGAPGKIDLYVGKVSRKLWPLRSEPVLICLQFVAALSRCLRTD